MGQKAPGERYSPPLNFQKSSAPNYHFKLLQHISQRAGVIPCLIQTVTLKTMVTRVALGKYSTVFQIDQILKK